MTKESLFHMCDTIRIIPTNAQFSLYFPEYLFLQIPVFLFVHKVLAVQKHCYILTNVQKGNTRLTADLAVLYEYIRLFLQRCRLFSDQAAFP